MKKNILLFGIGAVVLSACSTWEPDNVEFVNPGANGGIQAMYDGDGSQMDDYYVDVAAWNQRNQWNLANVHDPSVVLAEDGYYYMYQTDASYGNAHVGEGAFRGHFYCRRSKDLVNWQFMGPTMRHLPSWVGDSINSIRASLGLEPSAIDFAGGDPEDMGYWAPCVRKVQVNGQTLYRMYYSFNMPSADGASTLTDANLAPNMMGMMETTDPSDLDSWVDKGFVITQYSDQGKDYSGKGIYGGYYKYNVIDPGFIVTPEGDHWLIYGSWHSGFPAVKLDPATGKPYNDVSRPWNAEENFGKKVYTRVAPSLSGYRWQPSEGPEVVYHDGYYYLFMANDALDIPYCTTVVRSQNIDGPYYDITGVNFADGGTSKNVPAYPVLTHPYKFNASGENGYAYGWVGISHCAVFDDGNGNWFYCSQQRMPNGVNGNTASNALMMGGVRSIVWTEDGWPLVLPERYANVEQTAISESELVGKWEHINLVYSYGNQDASINIELTADHKVAGSWQAGNSWSFDVSKNILTIGSTKLYLRRELDWEMAAGTRTPTIVYAGLSASGKTTYWGKKVTE